MSARKHFIRLFKAELEDLAEDLELLEGRYRQRFERAEIGDYVFRENDAFLRRERDSIANFSKIVDGIDPALYKSMTDIEAYLLAKSREQVSSFEDPEAIYILLKRKIDKIHTYLATDEPESDCP